MATFHQSLDASMPEALQGGAVSIGNFDGVHRGHQALVAQTVRIARSKAGPAVAVTFDPHPQQLLHPETFQPVITTLEDRAQLLQSFGIDHVVVFRISESFLQLTAQEFFARIIRDGLRARAIVEGFNFGFGRGREGNVALLEDLGREAGILVTLVPALTDDGNAISTSRIRNALSSGDVSAAAQMLGRPYRLSGIVAAGKQRGQTLGFPTANLTDIATLIPGNGVYAVRAHHEGKTWPGAANVGPNPTFGEDARKVEVHLIGFEGNLYGRSLMVDFVEKIRDVRTFSGPAELREQLKLDIANCQASVEA